MAEARKGKTHKTVYKGLIRLTGETAFVSTSALEGSTRGGNFQIASIHEDLFALSLPSSDTSRFVPVPDVCLSLDNKTFNATLAILPEHIVGTIGHGARLRLAVRAVSHAGHHAESNLAFTMDRSPPEMGTMRFEAARPKPSTPTEHGCPRMQSSSAATGPTSRRKLVDFEVSR